ncbi:hypothetical protein [Janibacter sp. GS2]|uniref:hypothetical protein n=1 Tax=Janibacter sp. GS2 TaxID=3442646 RepID=UPI003EBDFAE0
MATSFRPASNAVRQLSSTSRMREAMVTRTEAGQRWAEANAPRRTGEYASSFEVRPATIDGKAGAVLVNTAAHAVFVEWANGAHVLTRAVDAIEKG